MKATEVIAALQTLIQEHGDLDCACIDDGCVVRSIDAPRIGERSAKAHGNATWNEMGFDAARFFVLE